MKLLSTLLTVVAMTCSATAMAQNVTFETEDYKAVGVYDGWVKSPFRTGQLQGNAAVVDNHLKEVDPVSGVVLNPSDKILGVQRSRFGSNTFGVRVDLKEPLALTTRDKYVHVLVHTPSTHRILLIGLGKRRERVGQSPEVEQFWELPMNPIVPNEWNDAVFAVRGANGVDIHSFVLVPDLNSPHDLTQDFAAYIDDIVVSDTEYTPRILKGDYTVNIDKNQARTRSDRPFNGVTLTTTSSGAQTLVTSRDTKVYNDRTDFTFYAKVGDALAATFDFPKKWMHGYVYLDRNNDGKFTYDLNDDHTPAANSEVLGYSYYQAYNSLGQGNVNQNTLNPPAMTVPADLAPGVYRIRLKVDWDMLDPGGRASSDNNIVANGGSITDALLKIYRDSVSVSDNQLNGEVLAANGDKLNKYQTPYGKPFTIKMNPENGFTHAGVRIRHGYNLQGDSVVHGNRQWKETFIPAAAFRDNLFTIPDSLMDGDVAIEGFMVEVRNTGSTEDYPVAFDKATAPADGTKVTMVGATPNKVARTTFTPPSDKAYSFVQKEIPFRSGEFVIPELTYSGSGMSAYFYVDLNEDGQFTPALGANGVPTYNSELLSYSQFNGVNSLGDSTAIPATGVGSLPKFTLSPYIPTGVYRARLKVEKNSILPEGTATLAADGGYIIDFLVNVHNEKHQLKVFTQDGSINSGSYNGQPEEITPFKALMYAAHGATPEYKFSHIKVRHGHRLEGPAYVRGNRQWSEFDIPVSTHTLRSVSKDSVNGDVHLSATFTPVGNPEYVKLYGEEFDANTAPPSWVSNGTKYEDKMAWVQSVAPSTSQLTSTKEFKYAKIEVRALTSPLSGSAPLIYLTPADGSPVSILLAGMKDAEGKVTVGVTSPYTANNTTPVSKKVINSPQDRFHTYSLEWTPDALTWYIDGRKVFDYVKTTNPDQWHFDKPFFLQVVQDLGNGTNAAQAQAGQVYQTKVDWVRIYQKPEHIRGISTVLAPTETERTYDLSGKAAQAKEKGVYIINGKKVIR